jgi:hypothetical protein
MGRFVLASILFVVVLSIIVDRHASERIHVLTGTVREWSPGESIVIANEQTEPAGVVVRLRKTRFEGNVDRIVPGSSVSVWFRSVGESQPIGDRVRVN